MNIWVKIFTEECTARTFDEILEKLLQQAEGWMKRHQQKVFLRRGDPIVKVLPMDKNMWAKEYIVKVIVRYHAPERVAEEPPAA